eukprot:gnl/Chilomastix_cuspidata/2468.p1 GENE.gnl/Chilomastix_cuspidata/2468~~gnl/Chilomastix_cuspidata/2468.p1  ORF type:complete len:518 (+),score=177.34 gnl/Chilomastix_cuspidata/2468:398-1951(+)
MSQVFSSSPSPPFQPSDLHCSFRSSTRKVVADSIHGDILLTRKALCIIDTPEFQRLRNIKQLGVTSLVFPCGTHSRFEHSLGVYHLSGLWANRFKLLQPDLRVEDNDISIVQMAGLIHDLGHGPFSHIFDNYVAPTVFKSPYSHEEQGCRVFDHLLERNGLDFDSEHVARIKSYVLGEPSFSYRDEPRVRFLFDIVSNKRNGIDVDRFDYLMRDARAVNFGLPCHFNRIISLSRVIDGQICFHEKEAYSLFELHASRYRMFREVYCHNASTAIELMVTDALVAAAEWLKLSLFPHDMEFFCAQSDSILERIECARDELRDAGVVKAQKIIRRIRTRRLYCMVRSCRLKVPREGRESWLHGASGPEIRERMVRTKPGLRAKDFRVVRTLFGIGGSRNPLEGVRFFGKDEHSSRELQPYEVSYLFPSYTREIFIRVYAVTCNKQRQHLIREAFNDLLMKESSTVPILDSSGNFFSPEVPPSKRAPPIPIITPPRPAFDAAEIPSQLARDMRTEWDGAEF